MSSHSPSFEDTQTRIQAYYQAGDYPQALAHAENSARKFPEQAALFTYWRVCFHARLEQADAAIQLLDSAIQDGLWYNEILLRKSPALKTMQGLPEFEHLVEQNRLSQHDDQAQGYPLMTLRSQGACSQGAAPCPTLIALHGNGSTPEAVLPFWRLAASAGWLVAAPRSSQAMWKDAYIWDDLEISHKDVIHHYQSLLKGYAVDQRSIVLAGHTMGGEVAIWLALSGALPVIGFLAFGPTGPIMEDPQQWQDLIDQAVARTPAGAAPLKGYLIYGENDSRIHRDGIHSLVKMMAHAGLPCSQEVVPAAGHDFDSTYEPALLRGLEFISSPQSS